MWHSSIEIARTVRVPRARATRSGLSEFPGTRRKIQEFEKANKPAEEQETEDLNDKEKALILAWREDPGIQWVSEQSMSLLN